MKKILEKFSKAMLMALGITLLMIPAKANADDVPVSLKELPQKAQAFINQHFSAGDILLAKMDKDLMGKTYTVKFKNGDEVEFFKSGEWKEVECVNSKVPEAIINPKILAKVKELYPTDFIKEIKKNKLNTEVKLSNGLELKFDKIINLVEVDD